MNEGNIINEVAETITGKPHILTVAVKYYEPEVAAKYTWIDKLLKRPSPQPVKVETERTFEIHPCVVANMYRIAGRASLLPSSLFDGELAADLLPFIPAYMPHLVYIIASAIQNNHLEPEPELIQFIERNFTPDDIFLGLNYSIDSVGLNSFLNSIVLVKGTVNVLNPETSPIDGRE